MKYYIVAGEASGDLHASNLMKSLKRLDDNAQFRFFGGDLMESVGGTLVKHYRELAFMGIMPVILNSRTILKNLSLCKKDIEEYQPDVMAIEAPFYGKNVQSMLKLGRAQGVAIAAAMRSGLTVDEYSPLKVKMAITGNGASSKEQVADMLRRFLHIPLDDLNLKLDATDALAVAYCHFLQKKNPVSDKPYKNWKDFLAKNGDRIKK